MLATFSERFSSKINFFTMFISVRRLLRNYSFNTLGSIWYCILATVIQIYIIYRSIYRFIAFVALPWPSGQPSISSINAYMLFIGCSIILLPFFILVAILRIGNYSNDGRKVGVLDLARYSKHLFSDVEEATTTSGNKEYNSAECGRNWLKALWKHTLPTAPVLQLLISFCFLFPRLITEAQLIRHGFLSKADIWKTDLDVVLAKLNGKQWNLYGFLRTINGSEHRSLFSDNASIGQYFIRNSKSLSDTFYELDESGQFSVEFANFLMALFIVTIRYPAVFWRANKLFSLIFSAHLVLNMVQSVIMLSAFQIAFKIFVCDPTHLLIRFRDSSSLSLMQLSALVFVYLLVLNLSGVSMYIYGINKYREYRFARTKNLQAKYQSKPYSSYFSFLLSLTFYLSLALLVGPLFYEFLLIYCGSLSINSLLITVSTVFHFICWIIFWVFLAIKTNWNFHYDDVENTDSLLDQTGLLDSSHLVIINNGNVYHVHDDATKQAIIGIVKKPLVSNQCYIDQENCSNIMLDRCKTTRSSFKSCKSEKPFHRTLNQNSGCRYSTRSLRTTAKVPAKVVDSTNELSDSEGEYTTFHKLRPSSFRHKNDLYGMSQKTYATRMEKQDPVTRDEQLNYEFTYMYNPLIADLEAEPNSPTTTLGHDKGSDTSSGIHSDGSNSSLTFFNCEKSVPMHKSNSLESLMNKLEAAAADKPNLRTLSSMQRSINILNQFDSSEPVNNNNNNNNKPSHVKLTSFAVENSIYGTKLNPSSKLIQFTENPDYSKYYIPPCNSSP